VVIGGRGDGRRIEEERIHLRPNTLHAPPPSGVTPPQTVTKPEKLFCLLWKVGVGIYTSLHRLSRREPVIIAPTSPGGSVSLLVEFLSVSIELQ
jgi:hypothetical protein